VVKPAAAPVVAAAPKPAAPPAAPVVAAAPKPAAPPAETAQAAAQGAAKAAALGMSELQKLPAATAADEWSSFMAKERAAAAQREEAAAAAAAAKAAKVKEGGVALGRKLRARDAELKMEAPWYASQPALAI